MEEIIKNVLEGKDFEAAAAQFNDLPFPNQEQLVTQLGSSRNENAGKFLALLYPLISDKKLQKLIKKSLFRLKSQGIHVEETREAGEPVLRKAEVTREARTFMSNYDPQLTKAVLVAVALKKNTYLFSHSVIHFSKGLVEMRSFPIAGKDVDALLGEYLSHTDPSMILAPIAAPYAGFMIEEAASRSGKEMEEAKSLNFFLAQAKGDVRKPQDIYALPVDDDVIPATRDLIFANPIFGSFKLSWPGIEEDTKKLEAAANPGIVLPQHVAQERLNAAVEELLREEKIAGNMPFFKRMLEDYAYLFFGLKEAALYKGLVDLLNEAEGVKGAYLLFIQKALQSVQQKKQEEQQPGVLVDPFARPRR